MASLQAFNRSMMILVSVLLVSFTAKAKDLVISDIDDTLKESHVLDTWDAASNALKTNIFFWGMPQLLTAIQLSGSNEIHYVSNAPSSVMGESHSAFIRQNNFPSGKLHLTTFGGDEEFKLATIRELVQKVEPTRIIMIGDNGQADSFVYETIKAENPGITSFILIRKAYSQESGAKTIPAGQIPFVTAGEAAAWLFELGVLPLAQTQAIIDLSVTRPGRKWADKEKKFPGASIGLPDWYDCQDHESNFPGSPFLATEVLSAKITARCEYVLGFTSTEIALDSELALP